MVIKDSNIRYLCPVDGDLLTRCTMPATAEIARFLALLLRRGTARICARGGGWRCGRAGGAAQRALRGGPTGGGVARDARAVRYRGTFGRLVLRATLPALVCFGARACPMNSGKSYAGLFGTNIYI